MKIVNLTDRELTKSEISSIKKFRSYTDGIGFACLKNRVMVMMPDETDKDPQTMKETALNCMKQALSVHPDLSTYQMDDGFCMVELPFGLFAIFTGRCEGSLSVYSSLRDQCLKACEDGEVIAVMYEEE